MTLYIYRANDTPTVPADTTEMSSSSSPTPTQASLHSVIHAPTATDNEITLLLLPSFLPTVFPLATFSFALLINGTIFFSLFTRENDQNLWPSFHPSLLLLYRNSFRNTKCFELLPADENLDTRDVVSLVPNLSSSIMSAEVWISPDLFVFGVGSRTVERRRLAPPLATCIWSATARIQCRASNPYPHANGLLSSKTSSDSMRGSRIRGCSTCVESFIGRI